jgi:undecaprenyl-diphosphatase
MLDPLRDVVDSLTDWLVDWAESPIGPLMLAVFSAAESVFFPIPPDPLLIALALANPPRALLFAVIATAASVVGGIVGHYLGRRFGRPLLMRFHVSRVERVEEMFRRHGFWAIVLAGLTPLPYKVFTIAAGVLDVPRRQFVIASIIGRGARFVLIGVLIQVWGDRFERFLDERFDLVAIALGVLLLAALLLLVGWSRVNSRRSRPVVEASLPAEDSAT